MSTRLHKLVIAALLLCQSLAFSQKTDLTCRELVSKTLKSVKELKGLKYHLKITERGKKGYNFYESSVKFNRSPRWIYLYIKGIEVLWRQGENDGKALIKPNSFPFFDLNLDPMGNLMRQDQHHTLNEMGYDYFAGVIQHSVDKLGEKFDEYFVLEGEERINNRPCYKITINNRDFAYTDYTIGENESITSIARKFYIAEYMILEKNPSIKSYTESLAGKTILIPNDYSSKMILYIDKVRLIPLVTKVYDNEGLYEQYEYLNVVLNPVIKPEEFQASYKDYHF